MSTTEPKQPRVLVYRVGSLGDTLLALPAFHLVRRAFPAAHITLLTSFPINAKAAPMESILAGTGLYDDTMRYPTSLRNLGDLWRLRGQIRAGRYDCLAYLARPKGGLLSSIRDWLFFRSCGIRRIVGIPFSRETLECQPEPAGGLFTSESKRTLLSIRELGEVNLQDDAFWEMHLGEGELGEAERLLAEHGIEGPFLAASVGTKSQTNDWEEHNWTPLMQRIAAAHPALPLVLFGVRDEWERSQRIATIWNGPVANLCGVTSPRVSAALLRKAALMVCHDSGPMHLAATVGVPCVAIFSARAKPGEWYPRGDRHTILQRQPDCWGCGLTECIEQRKRCILSIGVDEVFEAVQQRAAAFDSAGAASRQVVNS